MRRSRRRPSARCERRPGEVGIVDEVVGDAIDIPRDADGVDEAEGDEQPPRCFGKDDEEKNKVRRVGQRGGDGDDVL